VHLDASAGDRDQRAWVQDFRAVVRDFAGLAMVQLRNQPGIGHQPRISGQDAGDVFPQHHPPGVQCPGKEGRGQIGAAPPHRRDAAIGGAADEAGDDDDGAGGELRAQQPAGAAGGFRLIGGRRSVVLVSGDHIECVDIQRPPAGTAEGRRENLRGHALAAGDQPIAGARRQIVEQAHGGAQIAILPGRRIDQGEQLAPDRPRRNQRAYHFAVSAQERRGGLAHVRAPPGQRLRGPLEQQVGNARQRGRDHDERPVMLGNQRRRLLDLLGGGQRGAPELPDFERDLAAGGAGGA
jgi:hypothetical protein